jgi:cellulose synthase operon protein B
MAVYMRALFVPIFALVLFPIAAQSQNKTVPLPPVLHRPATVRAQTAAAVAEPAASARPVDLLAEVTLADIGFINGLRLSNLGGHQELFVPLPQDAEVTASELVLAVDDLSAHEAKRNLEVQANDRTVAAIALDGKSRDRIVRIPLGRMRPKEGYLKLTFLYSGAATLDRCIDVRYVGDSLTIRPETAVEVAVGSVGSLDVATTAMLMPRDVAIVLPSRRVAESEIATAVTVARSLISSGRRVSFHHGFEAVADLAKRDEAGRWAQGVVLVGPLAEAANVIDAPLARMAGAVQPLGTLAAVRVGGLPALLVSDSNVVRAGRLFASPLRAATRGMPWASVGEAGTIDLPTDRATFEQLAVAPAQADVFGRADLTTIIDIRRLPPGTRPTRLLLDVMVAPDGAGEKAVISVFVNERLLGSTVAAIGEPTHLDLSLPDGLFGTIANVRALVQRDSAQGECRFETQGYPAQILGSSSLVLTAADGAPHDFSDLTPHFARGIKLLVPAAAADQPASVLGILAQLVNQISPDIAPLSVNFTPSSGAPQPDAPFISVSDRPPSGANPRVRFDRGRVAVTDRSGRTLLDLGGFVGGAVAQLVNAGDYPGIWIKPLAADGSAPSPSELHLDHGDVAFIDGGGVALAMSTERDTVVRISYPDQVSWLTVAERFRSWIIGGLWLFATAALLFILQRLFRRRPARSNE